MIKQDLIDFEVVSSIHTGCETVIFQLSLAKLHEFLLAQVTN